MKDLDDLQSYLTDLIRATPDDAPRAFFLSDSVFLAVPVVADADANLHLLNSLIHVIDALTAEAFRLSLPLRGSFGFGSLAQTQQSLVGKAVLDAVTLGNSILPPLVVLARHTVLQAIHATSLAESLIIMPSGMRPRFNGFIDIPTIDGIILGQPILHEDATLATAELWLERTIAENLNSRSPHQRSAKTLRDTAALLMQWRRHP